MTTHHDIAIIGAGMAGLACATRLAEAGLKPVLFDKGRGPGGRMAARRAEVEGETVSFDHGAQYFTARDPAFQSALATWHKQGVVAAWEAPGPDAWVGVPGMNGPIRAMAEPLEVQWGVRVESLVRSGDHWQLQGAGVQATASTVLIAIPAEQAKDLLAEPMPEFAEVADSVRSAPCWAVMAAFAERLPIEADTLRDPDAAISWAARNSAKPERSGSECWVLHASPERSRSILDLPKEDVAEALLADFFAQAGVEPQAPLHLVAHRWLYAMAEAIPGDPARFEGASSIGLAGDYLHSPRVEGAFLSGHSLAGMVLDIAE
jgi:hypothetical protein